MSAKAQIAKAAREWWTNSASWHIALALAFALGWSAFHSERAELGVWLTRRCDARTARFVTVLLLATPAAQAAVGATRALAAHLARVSPIPGRWNLWPQRLLGLAETICYSIAFALLGDPKGVLTAIGAWITLKNFGKWPRLSGEVADPAQPQVVTTAPRSQPDQDEPRRRLYVFLLANALQVGWAVGIGYVLRHWALGR